MSILIIRRHFLLQYVFKSYEGMFLCSSSLSYSWVYLYDGLFEVQPLPSKFACLMASAAGSDTACRLNCSLSASIFTSLAFRPAILASTSSSGSRIDSGVALAVPFCSCSYRVLQAFLEKFVTGCDGVRMEYGIRNSSSPLRL